MQPGVLVAFAIVFVLLVGVGVVVIALIAQHGKPGAKNESESRNPLDPFGAIGGAAETWRTAGKENETQEVSDQPLKGEQLFPRLVRCSALVVTPSEGEGTGFVVHTANRLIVTNYHVVGRENKVIVVFPLYDKSGELITDTRKYLATPREIGVVGEVIDRDQSRDLALIRVERIPSRTSAVPLARKPAATGSMVYSVGGSGADDNLMWRLTPGHVRGRLQRRNQLQSGPLNCMILETDAPVNPGDSGGAVMNEHGELVAAVSHFNTRLRQVSGNIDIEEVRGFLSRHLSSR